MNQNSPQIRRPSHIHRTAPAFTLMEMLVVVAIILVLLAIALPVYKKVKERQHKQVALEKIRTLGGAIATYTSQSAGALPAEDTEGSDSWLNIAKPEAKDVWYNALPRLLGRKGAGDFSNSPRDFYTDDNLLFLPGANYPDKKKFAEPLFAVAFNTKLQRTDETGKKVPTLMEQITNPEKTVVLLEQGVVNEKRTLEVQTKKDYDGSPKGSAKSFVGRYGGQGVLYFLDGHAEFFAASDLLTVTGEFPFPQNTVVWTRTPEENPNKDGLAVAAKRDAKEAKKEKKETPE